MRAKKPFLIALFLCTWSIISYFLLIRQTDTGQDARHASFRLNEVRRQREDVLKQLNRIESNIYEENELHDQLVKKLIEIVRLKDQQPNGVNSNSILENNNKNLNDGIDKNGIAYDIKDDTNKIDGLDTVNGAENEINNEDEIQAQLIERLRKLNKPVTNQKGPTIAVLVFACNRISVRNCLDDLVQYRPNSHQFPIIVSQVSFCIIHNYYFYFCFTIFHYCEQKA